MKNVKRIARIEDLETVDLRPVVLMVADNWYKIDYGDLKRRIESSGFRVVYINPENSLCPAPSDEGKLVELDFERNEWRDVRHGDVRLYDVCSYQISLILDALPHEVDISDDRHFTVVKSVYSGARAMLDRAQDILDGLRVALVVYSQGFAFPNAALRALCATRAVPFVVLENSFDSSRLVWDDELGTTIGSRRLQTATLQAKTQNDEIVAEAADFVARSRDFKSLEHRSPDKEFPRSSKNLNILFIGQVFTDASVMFLSAPGFADPTDAMAATARWARENDAGLAIKLHPKEKSGNSPAQKPYAKLTWRRMSARADADLFAGPGVFVDHDNEFSTHSMIESADVVVTMSSQAGFEALLLGKEVICCGMPAYAGLGLTHDVVDEASLRSALAAATAKEGRRNDRDAVCRTLSAFRRIATIENSSQGVAKLILSKLERADRYPGSKVKVSIVVNNYNYERFLGAAIESALDQTHPNCEVIVVDDGSTDGSRDVISRYPAVKTVFKENGGQASAFNAGFRASQGDVVIFLDADDTLKPHAAETVAAAWRPDASHVNYAMEFIDADGRSTGIYPESLRLASGKVWEKILYEGMYSFMPTSGNAWSRSALEKIYPLPEANWKISADLFLALAAARFGRVIAVNEVLASYRAHGANQHFHALGRTKAMWERIFRHRVLAYGDLTDFALRKDGERDLWAALAFQRHTLICVTQHPGIFQPAQARREIHKILRRLARTPIPLREKFRFGKLFLLASLALAWKPAAYYDAHVAPDSQRAFDRLLARARRASDGVLAKYAPGKQLKLLDHGSRVSFARGGQAASFLREGWSEQEKDFIWSIDGRSSLAFKLPAQQANWRIVLDVMAFVHGEYKQQRMLVYANGSFLGSFTLRGRTKVEASLPDRALTPSGDAAPVEMTLVFPDCRSPAALGRNQDRRVLGGALYSLGVMRVEPTVLGAPFVAYGESLAPGQAPMLLRGGWRWPEPDGSVRSAAPVANLAAALLKPAREAFVRFEFGEPVPQPVAMLVNGSSRSLHVGACGRVGWATLPPTALSENGVVAMSLASSRVTPDGHLTQGLKLDRIVFHDAQILDEPERVVMFGERRSFGGGQNRHLLVEGWGAHSQVCSWMAARRARLRLSLPPADHPRRMTIGLVTQLLPEGEVAGESAIRIDGEEIVRVVPGPVTDVVLTLPSSAGAGGKPIDIEFDAPSLISPAILDIDGDFDPVGLGLAYVQIDEALDAVPKDDSADQPIQFGQGWHPAADGIRRPTASDGRRRR